MFFSGFPAFDFSLVFLSFWNKKIRKKITRKTRTLFFLFAKRLSENLKNIFSFFFRERHGHAPRKRKKTRFLFFLLPREAQPCLSEMKKIMLFHFFPFHERHGSAFARGVVLLPRTKKNSFSFFFRERHGRASRKRLPKRKKSASGTVSSSAFLWKKSSSKPANMGI